MLAFGNIYGFLFIWTFIIIILPASFALTALTFADYSLQPLYPSCEPPLTARLLLAAAALSNFNKQLSKKTRIFLYCYFYIVFHKSDHHVD